jgi:hypothetical protein
MNYKVAKKTYNILDIIEAKRDIFIKIIKNKLVKSSLKHDFY